MSLRIELGFSQSVSYVMYQNNMRTVISAKAFNEGEAVRGVTFRMSSDPPFFAPVECKVDSIEPGELVDLASMKGFDVSLDPDAVSSMTERTVSKVTLTAIDQDGNETGRTETDCTVLPFDDWPGCGMAETIVSFITPNATSMARIRSSASDILGEWGKSPSLDGYQSGDRNRALDQGAAVYAALERLNMNYVNPPASFEERGQRVRLPDDAVSNLEGTCLDLTVLYASVLESIGLNPLVFFITGHAFAGFWLVDEVMPDIVSFDSAEITRMIRNREMRAVECTTFTNAGETSFEEACDISLRNLERMSDFICAIDVKRARGVIHPLPTRRLVGDRWVVEREERESSTTAPESAGKVYEAIADRPLTRADRWKRDLLDITNRNNLINMKAGGKVSPLLVGDVVGLEDRLASGSEFTLLPKPQEWDGTKAYGERPFESELYIGNYAGVAPAEMAQGRIRTPQTETETEKTLRSIYRRANNELEESGCNALFVAIGVLRWFEGRSTGIPRYAPLILVPVEMKRRQKGFSIRKMDEETLFNVTLLEKLRQEFDVDLPNMDPLPSDDDGVDVDRILQEVRRRISGKEGWEVMASASLGIFSFNQFVMWKDLDANMDAFRENNVVRCLMDSTAYPGERELKEDADPYGLCLAVPADGSQVKAVRATRNGRTFVMHGPPGTGKSQTITNIICDELAAGRRVLFVAEKRAALEVVQKRLDGVGIGNHCLELHSNKAGKAEVLQQLKRSMDSAKSVDEGQLRTLIERLEAARSKLDMYVSDLHRERGWGFSAYECISRYEAHDRSGTVDIQVPPGSVQSMRASDVADLEGIIRNACQAHGFVRGVDCEELRHVRTENAIASINTDVRDAIDRARTASKNLTEKKSELSACNLPVDIGDPSAVSSYFEFMKGLDPRITSDRGLESLPDEARSLASSIESIVTEVSGWPRDLSIDQGSLSRIRGAASKAAADLRDVSSRGLLDDIQSAAGLLDGVVSLCDDISSASSDMAAVATQWTFGAYALDDSRHLSALWQEAGSKGFFSRGKAKKEFMAVAGPYLRSHDTEFDDLAGTVGVLGRLSGRVLGMQSSLEACSDRSSIDGCADVLRRLASEAEACIAKASGYGIQPSGIETARKSTDSSAAAFGRYTDALAAWNSAAKAASDVMSLDTDVSDPGKGMALLENLSKYVQSMYDWANWNRYSGRLSASGLGDAISLIREGMAEGDIIDSAYKSVYAAMILLCRQDSESLRMFSASTFESMVAKFKEMDMEYADLNRRLLRYRLFLNVPRNDDEHSDELAILLRAINSSRLRKSIRTLLSEIPNILPRICPCMLMSPQSVAQYITMDVPKFDLIIFDESSQITTCKAIGSLGRAKAAVIAGDSKQLPPTSFFQRKIESTDEDDDMVDIDSFLDDCLSLNMPETYLEWHYRSSHESLIAFSNRTFYDNKMLTFPSPNDQETRVSMHLVKGVYERGKGINPIEARAVVDEIRRRVIAHPDKSIGVVAFSVRQQECINDMLDDATRDDREFFEKVSAMPEELFIKNLENVQGDERDVILFSIGYGSDANGTVYQNFGPINREGGGRRLNVAVSRARMEMVVFSSMRCTDVKLTPTSSSGVRCLEEFLRYAENGGRFGNRDHTAPRDSESTILTEIAAGLAEHGYTCHFDIGSSEFRVDVAVVDPDSPSDYILGILNDGESYRNSDNTRDREYARADVLRNNGWKLMHVWSLEWYFKRDQTMRSILAELERLREENMRKAEEATSVPDIQAPDVPEAEDEPEPAEDTEEATPSIVQPAATDTTRFASAPAPATPKVHRRQLYVQYSDGPFSIDLDISTGDTATIRRRASAIIEHESPITEEHLVKLYSKTVGIKRLSASRRADLVSILRKIFMPEIDGDFVTYWSDSMDKRFFDSYRVTDDPDTARDITDVPLAEIVSACVDTVAVGGPQPLSEAVSAIGRTLGYSRAGNKVRDLVSKALEVAVRDGRLEITDGCYSLPSE